MCTNFCGFNFSWGCLPMKISPQRKLLHLRYIMASIHGRTGRAFMYPTTFFSEGKMQKLQCFYPGTLCTLSLAMRFHAEFQAGGAQFQWKIKPWKSLRRSSYMISPLYLTIPMASHFIVIVWKFRAFLSVVHGFL